MIIKSRKQKGMRGGGKGMRGGKEECNYVLRYKKSIEY